MWAAPLSCSAVKLTPLGNFPAADAVAAAAAEPLPLLLVPAAACASSAAAAAAAAAAVPPWAEPSSLQQTADGHSDKGQGWVVHKQGSDRRPRGAPGQACRRLLTAWSHAQQPFAAAVACRLPPSHPHLM